MSSALANWADVAPDVQHLITEDDEPVDNLPSEKQQRLLTESLYSSWDGPGDGRPFLAAANVGVFYLARRPAIVPDVLLSLDVEVTDDWWEKEHRSYFLWEFGKPPDLALEIVSNREGEEDGEQPQGKDTPALRRGFERGDHLANSASRGRIFPARTSGEMGPVCFMRMVPALSMT